MTVSVIPFAMRTFAVRMVGRVVVMIIVSGVAVVGVVMRGVVVSSIAAGGGSVRRIVVSGVRRRGRRRLGLRSDRSGRGGGIGRRGLRGRSSGRLVGFGHRLVGRDHAVALPTSLVRRSRLPLALPESRRDGQDVQRSFEIRSWPPGSDRSPPCDLGATEIPDGRRDRAQTAESITSATR